MCIGVIETASPAVLWRTQKSSLCKAIWLVFVCAHARSYIFMTYENVSGSFETPSCFRNVHTLHELACVRKVVTRSLPRFLLVYDTCRHIRTKGHTVIWTCVRTQETKRDLRRKTFLDSSHDQWDESFTDVQEHIGLGRAWNMKVCVVVSKSRLWEHILLFNSWSSRCPSCPSSPPSFLHATFRVRGRVLN